MATKRYDQLSPEEKSQLFKSQGGIDRVLKLQEKHLEEVSKQISHILSEIRDKESMAVSWTSLMIVLALMQIFQLRANFEKQYIFMCLPSFIFAFMSAALTLLKHPNYIKSDFFTTEDENKQLRLDTNDKQTKALNIIFQSLHARYQSKNKSGKFVGQAVIVNFISNISFLIIVVFMSNVLTLVFAIIYGLLSLVIIYFYTSKNTKSLTFNYIRKLT